MTAQPPYPYDKHGVPQPYYGGSLSEHMAAGGRIERYLAERRTKSKPKGVTNVRSKRRAKE